MEKTIFRPKDYIWSYPILLWCSAVAWIMIGFMYLARNGASSLYGWIPLIVAALWIIISIIFTKRIKKSRKAVILLSDDGIFMSDCAVLVKDNRLSEPMTLDIKWMQVDKVEHRTIVLHSGEVYSDINWNMNKRFYDRTNMSSFDEIVWAKIENSFYRYKNKTQE